MRRDTVDCEEGRGDAVERVVRRVRARARRRIVVVVLNGRVRRI